MFTDNDITQAAQRCGQLREHLATIAGNQPSGDSWWSDRLATVDEPLDELLSKRNAGS